VANIFMAPYSFNIHAYGSSAAYLDDFVVEDNIATNEDGDGRVMVGGGNDPNRLKMNRNLTYNANIQIGYGGGTGDDIEAKNNMCLKGYFSLGATFTNLVQSDNFSWRSEWTNPQVDNRGIEKPSQPKVIIIPNKYDSRRANLAVYNFAHLGLSQVSVDLGSFLQPGEFFELKDPQNFYGPSVLSGKYTGAAISLSMKNEFSVFILFGMEGTNRRPVVDAGADQIVEASTQLNLRGTANDDGLPNPPGQLSYEWLLVSGPSVPLFSSPQQLMTNVQFAQTGTYILRLKVKDGSLEASDEVVVTVKEKAQDNGSIQINVFNPIKEKLGVLCRKEVKIFNRQGALVKTLTCAGGPEPSLVEWDGRNEKGVIVASGVYVYSTQNSDGETVTKKIVVLK